MKTPLKFYRPDKTPDSQGGFTQVPVLIGNIYGNVVVYRGETRVVNVDIHEDVRIGDVVEVKE